jgi:hypothetical protein
MTVSDKLEIMCKEAVMTYFNLIFMVCFKTLLGSRVPSVEW